MKRGERIPLEIRRFIIKTKSNAPRLSYGDIAARVASDCGVTIDKSSVGRIWRQDGRPPSETRQQVATASESDARLRHHENILLAVLRDFEGIAAFPPRGQEIQTWLERDSEPRWPMSKGFVCRDPHGNISVCLSVEDGLEWDCLQQHLVSDPIWGTVSSWKAAIAADMTARYRLFMALRSHAQSGTRLPVISETEIMDRNRDKPALGLYYVHTLYDQVVAQAIGIPLAPKRKDEFVIRDGRRLELGVHTVAVVASPRQRRAVVDFLIKAQSELQTIREAKAAARAYQRGQQATGELKKHLRRILVAPGLPPGSLCDSCRPWHQRAAEHG